MCRRKCQKVLLSLQNGMTIKWFNICQIPFVECKQVNLINSISKLQILYRFEIVKFLFISSYRQKSVFKGSSKIKWIFLLFWKMECIKNNIKRGCITSLSRPFPFFFWFLPAVHETTVYQKENTEKHRKKNWFEYFVKCKAWIPCLKFEKKKKYSAHFYFACCR